VNGWRLTAERLREAVAASAGGKAKLGQLVENGDYLRTHKLDYDSGERYPHLERDPAKPDLLGDILRPRAERHGPAETPVTRPRIGGTGGSPRMAHRGSRSGCMHPPGEPTFPRSPAARPDTGLG
jgi:hypothetical protein